MFAFMQGVLPTKMFIGIVLTLLALLAGSGWYLKHTLEANAVLGASVDALTATLQERNETIAAERDATRRVQRSNVQLQRKNNSLGRAISNVPTTRTTATAGTHAIANILCQDGLATASACSAILTPLPAGGLSDITN